MPATLSDAGDTSGKGNADDGLFDATYSFLVPATLTGGTLTVATGSFTGAEFTLYTAESGTTTLEVTAPASLALSFPAPAAEAIQHAPPWVGEPNPATSAAASNATSSSASGGSGSHGFPIWLAIVVLLALAGVAVLAERRRRRAGLASAAAPAPTAPAPVVVPEPEDTEVGAPVVAPAPPAQGESSEEETPALNVLGPHEILGLKKAIGPRIVELLIYLAFHAQRHLRAGQIQIGMSPSGTARADLAEKTIRNYLHQLRGAIGVEHLPEASAKEGYILVGVPTDYERFSLLARQADVLGGDEADRARTEALSLVRGVPFCDLDYEWIGPEGLANQMRHDIAAVARRLAEDRYLAADFLGAHDAAARGLVGAPDDYALWEAGAVALDARGDTTALGRWLDDASHHLEGPELARIEARLRRLHDDAPHS